jgi:hypothetical protein
MTGAFNGIPEMDVYTHCRTAIDVEVPVGTFHAWLRHPVVLQASRDARVHGSAGACRACTARPSS